MRAVVYEKYGGPEVLHLVDVEQPVPQDDEVLVKIHATTVNRTDCGWRAAKPFFARYFTGLVRPKQQVLGSELSGEIVAVGSAVTQFEKGDDVFGINAAGYGAHAEYVCMRETAPLTTKPSNMSFEEAGAVCDGAIIALSCLRASGLQKDQRILVYGASGSIGTAAVQLAKHSFGAHVTAVCKTKSMDLAASLGADEVVDYTAGDFTKSGETYGVVFDSVGKTSFRRCRGLLRKGGMFVSTDLGFMWHVPLLALTTRWIGSKQVTLPLPKYSKENVVFLKELIEAGKYRAVIDRTYPLEETMIATKYVETGQKTGNVVITVS